jgi:hypothetical protein
MPQLLRRDTPRRRLLLRGSRVNVTIPVGEIARPRVCYSIDPTAVRPLIEFLERIETASPPRFLE